MANQTFARPDGWYLAEEEPLFMELVRWYLNNPEADDMELIQFVAWLTPSFHLSNGYYENFLQGWLLDKYVHSRKFSDVTELYRVTRLIGFFQLFVPKFVQEKLLPLI